MQQAILTKSDNEAHIECINGNPRAQTDFYGKYYKMMFNSAYRILRDKVEAEDIMQESFIIAFRRLAEVKEIEKTGAWLKRIVINNSINQLKRKKRFIDEWNDNLEIKENIDESPFEEADVKQIYNAIEDLAEGYRMILSLYLIEGYDHSEIAEILKITSSTSRSQYTRAKVKLKEILIMKYGR